MSIESLLTRLATVDTSGLSTKERVDIYNQLSDISAAIVGIDHPVLNVKLISTSQVKNNDYNPNSVAPPEFRLLKHSIRKDGLTMPVVVGKDKADDMDYVIIDGHHRTQIIQNDLSIKSSLESYVPVVILKNSLDERMSSSIRHNMARGAHQVELTARLVIKLKEMAWTNEDIGRELGMDGDEVLRMQQITGLAEAFKHQAFSNAWDTHGTAVKPSLDRNTETMAMKD